MKISVDDEELFSLSKIQKKVIQNDINEDFLEEDLRRRLQYILQHKYEQSFKRLKDKWEPIFKREGAGSIPLNEDDFSSLVFDHPDYKSKKERDDDDD